ncbi:hypothetical protein Pint_26691 [Pistacia integerrima]|uniref:Uncharacterized protein n=1 Tax=Pistacia integerrima TaxID=434235 RepID=A0ACC0YN86_9ROSI|nr:hypothetical protein Pint_26691 [Pistacia integerrima]
MEDQKQTVLITGCSQGGIRHALAHEFASKGCIVVASSRSKRTMADLENDSRFFVQELDVVSDKSVENVVANVIEKSELHPFGIHVTLVAPGAIKSNIANVTAGNYSRMPELKLYKPFENIIKERAYFKEPPNATPTEIFARKTVAVLFKDKPPAWFSFGKYSTLVEIYSCMPNFVKDFLARRMMK